MTTRRRVLFVTQSHNIWGGMEQWLHKFTLWLQTNTEWDVRVALPRGRKFNDPDAFLRAHSHMTPVILDVRVGTETVRVNRIARAIAALDADLVVPIATGDVIAAVAKAKARGSRVRFLQPIRALVPELLANTLDAWPVIDGVVSISRLFHRFFEAHLRDDPERLHYVRHGSRPPVVAHSQTGATLRLGFVGRIEPEMKRVFDLVPFIDAVARRGADAEVHVFGSGPAEGELRSRLAPSPLAVMFHGYKTQDELYRDAYPNIDVALLFSGSGEGTPNAICEAMQYGAVPVISRYPGQAGERYVMHGRNGLTFAIGDVESAAGLVTQLANDRALLERLSNQARRDVESDTDVRMHRDWLAIFEKTLSLPQKRGSISRPSREEYGRLNRMVPSSIADALRGALHRYYPHQDGWGEWPGTTPVARERLDQIVAELDAIDQADQRAMHDAYTSPQ